MLRYCFEEIRKCEMCGADAGAHKVLGQRLNTTQGFNPRKKSGISVSVKECRNCGLIFSNPQPTPFDIQDHYGTPPEEYWHPSYFEWTPDYFAHEIGVAKDLLDFKKGMRALDIGAGLGKGMISLTNAGFDTYGFEPSVPFHERAISKMNIDPARLKLGMMEEVQYDEQSFDFISFGAVFEHLYHPASCLETALRWLKFRGIIHIEVPSSKYFISSLMNLYYNVMGTNYVTHLSPMHAPFHMYEFHKKSFEELSKTLNYEIVKTEYLVGGIFHFPKFTHSLLKTYMKKTDTGMQLILWLRK